MQMDMHRNRQGAKKRRDEGAFGEFLIDQQKRVLHYDYPVVVR